MNDFKEMLISTREQLFDLKYISYDVFLIHKTILKAYHINRGYESLSDNYICAKTMLRLHLENLFRLWEALIVESSNYLSRYIKNIKLERLYAKDGKKLTMASLAISLGSYIHKIELYDIYNVACDYVHTSSFKEFIYKKGEDIIISDFKSPVGTKEKWRDLEYYIQVVHESYKAVLAIYLNQLNQFKKVDAPATKVTEEKKAEMIESLTKFLNNINI